MLFSINNAALDFEMHEVITLQFGQQANHVGTHFWNAQVSPLFFPQRPQPLTTRDWNFEPITTSMEAKASLRCRDQWLS